MSRNIVLGVAGGIAAYKACELLRRCTEAGHRVRVVPTPAALRFVGAPTWEALSGQPVHTGVFDDVPEVEHVELGQRADLVIVAPATADLLARAAAGRADDLLTATLLAARGPVVFAPAMHTEMWQHPATVANVATLRSRGAIVVEPDVGRLTGPDTGKGRLPDPAALYEVVEAVLAGRYGQRADLAGRHVVVSAGGTREYLDPVRFVGNRSSGKQGYAFARAALARGARVTLVAANVTLPAPAGADLVRVETTEQLRQALLAVADADAMVFAAAPADFRPAHPATSKIKKSPDGTMPPLELAVNPDIAAELGAAKRPGQVLVAFAAETDDLLDNAAGKLARKRADLIVANKVGPDQGFGTDTNAATVLDADGGRTDLTEMSKVELADEVLDLVVSRLGVLGPGAGHE
ncbi:bifunctional phosphopantothenoylcysteine decarboxylase/phosphopantothenate--cysteine ligase CoaBC [Actinocatenispora comari]|uniref:Coenzyme A biosynthesis bifunctional protein CoaBC n=1 Tax=Actinocatenispora comari TaxID=2807577 RepID=A0A8J4AJ12_9ACTN|nr:bifunctional phosphopantothenoylcysteine decarboxylase/phosphopantothenate--cysteine ligase CoaBC [Actinocatenispora comari]GIL30227.1 phosphopantothenoylcysteine decarboxylase [Actinocatenispora comari]